MWELATNSNPKARKAHRCDQCFKEIRAGEKYVRVDGIWEGEFSTYKSHQDCQDAADYLSHLADLYSDEWINLCEGVEMDDRPILIEKFPEVAKRLGIL